MYRCLKWSAYLRLVVFGAGWWNVRWARREWRYACGGMGSGSGLLRYVFRRSDAEYAGGVTVLIRGSTFEFLTAGRSVTHGMQRPLPGPIV